MSATARATAPATRTSWRPRLSVVRSPEPQRSVLPFFLLCGALLVGSLIAGLLLNTAMAVSSYDVHAAQRELVELRETEQDLQAELNTLGSPGVLQQRASELGMVAPETTAYLSLESGTILGSAGDGS